MKEKVWTWFFLLSGICGSLLLLQSAEGLAWNDRGAFLIEAGVLCFLWILFEVLMKWHWPVYLCVTVLMLWSVLYGIEWKISTLFFMEVFQFSFWMFHNLEKSLGSLSPRMWGRISLVLPVVLFLAAVVCVQWKCDWFYEAVYQVEGTVRRNLKRASGASENFSDGVINRGNIYPAGIEQFRVRVSKKPSEEMYLKNFSGGTYTDGKWEHADDGILFERMNQNTLHWEHWEGWIPNLYESLYFAMNRSAGDSGSDSRELFMQYKNSSAQNWYVPYYGRWDKNYRNAENDAEYRLEYYERGDMEINWDKGNKYFETAKDWYHEVQEAYLKEAKEVYTDLPGEALPGLVSLCEAHPMEDQERITEFICSYLQENISYTRAPGMIPFQAEPVEYFLFDKKEGCCQHFASAAVLMYRMYGIPARYATGYQISPSDFEYQEDGCWHAVVTDQSAHAWPEIFAEDYGWIPVEVTISTGSAAEPADESNGQQAGLSRQPDNSPLSSDDSGRRTNSEERQEPGSETSLSGRDIWFPNAVIKFVVRCMIVLVISAVLWMALWNYRIKWIWMKKGGSRRIYSQLLRMIHFAGYLRDYDGSEKEFPVKLAECFPVISYEEAERLVDTVNEEAFGRPGMANSDRTDFVTEIYRHIMNSLFPKSFFL